MLSRRTVLGATNRIVALTVDTYKPVASRDEMQRSSRMQNLPWIASKN
jgi:hypothetical protein